MATHSMFAYVLLLYFIAYAAGNLSENCLNCICQVEGCQGQIGKCRWDVHSDSCGPFQIKQPYWLDCKRPGGDWRTCAKQDSCSRTCVRAYMQRYAKRCTGGRTPTCQDYARIHNGGPSGCTRSSTLGYWSKVQRCCSSKGRCWAKEEISMMKWFYATRSKTTQIRWQFDFA